MVSSSEKAIQPELWNGGKGKPWISPGQFCRGGVDIGRSD